MELNFQPLSICLDRARVSRMSSLASSFIGGVKETSSTVTSWRPILPKPLPLNTHYSKSSSPSPPISPHDFRHTRPIHFPPSSFPHNIPGRNPPRNTSPQISPHSASPRGFLTTPATAPQPIIPVRATPPQSLALRTSLSNSFPRNKVQTHNPPLSHNLLSYTNSPLQNDFGFGPSFDSHSPSSNFFANTNIPHGITIPMVPQPISGLLPASSSPAGRPHHHGIPTAPLFILSSYNHTSSIPLPPL